MKKILLTFILPAIVIIVLWEAAAAVISSPLILPAPLEVAGSFSRLAVTSLFWQHIAHTLLRTFSAFTISLCISLVLGSLSGMSKTADAMLMLPMSIIKATPVVSFILLALFWFTSSQVPVFVSVLMTLPVLTSSVSLGIKKTDKKLLEMAHVYGLKKGRIIKNIYFPSIIPSFASGSLAAFGLSWKVVVAAEVISLPRYASGSALQTAKVHLETSDVFSISICVIVLSFFCELIFSLFISMLLKKGKLDV